MIEDPIKNSNSAMQNEVDINLIYKSMILRSYTIYSITDVNSEYLSNRKDLIHNIFTINTIFSFKTQTAYRAISFLDYIYNSQSSTNNYNNINDENNNDNKNEKEYYNNYHFVVIACYTIAIKICQNDADVPSEFKILQEYTRMLRKAINVNNKSKINKILKQLNFDDFLFYELETIKNLKYDLFRYTLYDFNYLYFFDGFFIEEEFNNNLNNSLIEKIYIQSREICDYIVINEPIFLLLFKGYLIVKYIVLHIFYVVTGYDHEEMFNNLFSYPDGESINNTNDEQEEILEIKKRIKEIYLIIISQTVNSSYNNSFIIDMNSNEDEIYSNNYNNNVFISNLDEISNNTNPSNNLYEYNFPFKNNRDDDEFISNNNVNVFISQNNNYRDDDEFISINNNNTNTNLYLDEIHGIDKENFTIKNKRKDKVISSEKKLMKNKSFNPQKNSNNYNNNTNKKNNNSKNKSKANFASCLEINNKNKKRYSKNKTYYPSFNLKSLSKNKLNRLETDDIISSSNLRNSYKNLKTFGKKNNTNINKKFNCNPINNKNCCKYNVSINLDTNSIDNKMNSNVSNDIINNDKTNKVSHKYSFINSSFNDNNNNIDVKIYSNKNYGSNIIKFNSIPLRNSKSNISYKLLENYKTINLKGNNNRNHKSKKSRINNKNQTMKVNKNNLLNNNYNISHKNNNNNNKNESLKKKNNKSKKNNSNNLNTKIKNQLKICYKNTDYSNTYIINRINIQKNINNNNSNKIKDKNKFLTTNNSGKKVLFSMKDTKKSNIDNSNNKNNNNNNIHAINTNNITNKNPIYNNIKNLNNSSNIKNNNNNNIINNKKNDSGIKELKLNFLYTKYNNGKELYSLTNLNMKNPHNNKPDFSSKNSDINSNNIYLYTNNNNNKIKNINKAKSINTSFSRDRFHMRMLNKKLIYSKLYNKKNSQTNITTTYHLNQNFYTACVTCNYRQNTYAANSKFKTIKNYYSFRNNLLKQNSLKNCNYQPVKSAGTETDDLYLNDKLNFFNVHHFSQSNDNLAQCKSVSKNKSSNFNSINNINNLNNIYNSNKIYDDNDIDNLNGKYPENLCILSSPSNKSYSCRLNSNLITFSKNKPLVKNNNASNINANANTNNTAIPYSNHLKKSTEYELKKNYKKLKFDSINSNIFNINEKSYKSHNKNNQITHKLNSKINISKIYNETINLIENNINNNHTQTINSSIVNNNLSKYSECKDNNSNNITSIISRIRKNINLNENNKKSINNTNAIFKNNNYISNNSNINIIKNGLLDCNTINGISNANKNINNQNKDNKKNINIKNKKNTNNNNNNNNKIVKKVLNSIARNKVILQKINLKKYNSINKIAINNKCNNIGKKDNKNLSKHKTNQNIDNEDIKCTTSRKKINNYKRSTYSGLDNEIRNYNINLTDNNIYLYLCKRNSLPNTFYINSSTNCKTTINSHFNANNQQK